MKIYIDLTQRVILDNIFTKLFYSVLQDVLYNNKYCGLEVAREFAQDQVDILSEMGKKEHTFWWLDYFASLNTSSKDDDWYARQSYKYSKKATEIDFGNKFDPQSLDTALKQCGLQISKSENAPDIFHFAINNNADFNKFLGFVAQQLYQEMNSTLQLRTTDALTNMVGSISMEIDDTAEQSASQSKSNRSKKRGRQAENDEYEEFFKGFFDNLNAKLGRQDEPDENVKRLKR